MFETSFLLFSYSNAIVVKYKYEILSHFILTMTEDTSFPRFTRGRGRGGFRGRVSRPVDHEIDPKIDRQNRLSERLYSASHSSEALEALGNNIELLYTEAESGYDGHARIIAKDLKTNEIVCLAWGWGCCSHCDSLRDQPHELVVNRQRSNIQRFVSLEAFREDRKSEVDRLTETKYVSEDDIFKAVRMFTVTKDDQELQSLIEQVKSQDDDLLDLFVRPLKTETLTETETKTLAIHTGVHIGVYTVDGLNIVKSSETASESKVETTKVEQKTAKVEVENKTKTKTKEPKWQVVRRKKRWLSTGQKVKK